MLKEKVLTPHIPNNIIDTGRYIKVLSCANKFQLIVMSAGKKVLDTDVYAGFEITPDFEFDSLQLISKTEQTVEMWVSSVRMQYDALSRQPNKSESFISNHYGLSQQLLSYDTSQARAKISCDALTCWVGGENVDSSNGVLLNAGDVYTHESAAPLHAYINARPDKTVSLESMQRTTANNISAKDGVFNNGYLLHNADDNKTYISSWETGESTQLQEPVSSIVAYKAAFVGLRQYDSRYIAFVSNNKFEIVLNTLNANFFASCCIAIDSKIVVLGSSQSNENKVCIYDASSKVWSDKPLPAQLLSENITSALFDEYTNSVYFIASNKLYRTADMFATVELLSSDTDKLTGLVVSFCASESAIMIICSTSALVFVRDTKAFVDVKAALPDVRGGALLGRQWLLWNKDVLLSSDDMLETYHTSYTHDYDVAMGSFHKLTVCTVLDDKFMFYTKSNENAEIVSMSLEPDLSTPKAVFRVLKESY